MAVGRFPKGSQMQAGDVSTPTNFVNVPLVRTMTLSNLTADKLDGTNHDTPSNFRDWLQGLKDWGPLAFECLWDPQASMHTQFFNDFKAGTERYYRVLILAQTVTLATFTFKAFVGNYPFTIPFDALLTLNVELQIKGAPEPTLIA